ncbi:MAG: hypothetical protein ACK5OB_00220 [Pirellula sp.]
MIGFDYNERMIRAYNYFMRCHRHSRIPTRCGSVGRWVVLAWSCMALFTLVAPPTLGSPQATPNGSLQAERMDAFGFDPPDLISEPPAAMLPRLSRIAPVLIDQCVGCHNAQQAEGGYSMATPQSLMQPGDSKQAPIVVRAVPAQLAIEHSPEADYGELYRRLVLHDADRRMPKDSDPLDWDSIESIRQWIATGAVVDGGLDAPLEGFIKWNPPAAPRFPSYPKAHAASAVAIHPSKKFLFVAGYEEVLVWSVDIEPKLVDRLSVRGRFISDLEWNAAFESLCVASGEPGRVGYVESIAWPHPRDATLSLETYSDASTRQTHWACRDVPLDIAISHTGERLAIGNADGTVVAVDLLSNRILWKSASHAAAVTSVDWSEDGQTLVSSSRDRTAKSYQADDGAVLHGFADHERIVGSIRFMRRGLASWDEAGVLRWFPNTTTSNAKTSRTGLTQQTAKILASGDTMIVPTDQAIRRFQLRREEIVESKDEEGKEKKKTNYHIDDAPSLSLQNWPSLGAPISMALLKQEHDWILAGFADGHVMLWSVDKAEPVLFKNQPRLRSEP